jgi:hypothetical protein
MLGSNILKFLTPLLEDKVEMMKNNLKWKLSVGSGKSTKFGCKWTFIHLVVCLTTGPKPLPKQAVSEHMQFIKDTQTDR